MLTSVEMHFHIGGLFLFWFAVSAVIAISGTWLFNLLTPDKYHFLSESRKVAALGQCCIIAGMSGENRLFLSNNTFAPKLPAKALVSSSFHSEFPPLFVCPAICALRLHIRKAYEQEG
jgi:hypothetical protein